MHKLLLASAAMLSSVSAQATLIDFESVSAGSYFELVQGDYKFTAIRAFSIVTSSGSNALFPASPFAPPYLFDHQITLSRVDGGAFTLAGLDVFAGDSNGLGVPLGFSATSASGPRNYSITLPEFGNGAPIPTTRVALDFGNSLIDVTSLTWSNGAEFHQVDNLRLSAAAGGIPEPMTWAMLVLGFGTSGCALRRGRARQSQAATSPMPSSPSLR